ncbi:type II toxin-antitoxin system prevent-host-death family antitoxin [soil metagenome]
MTSPTLKAMKIVRIHEAKTHLSRPLKEVQAGEEIVIARGNTPVAKLVIVESARTERQIGWGKGSVLKIAEDFDAPLEDFDEYQ